MIIFVLLYLTFRRYDEALLIMTSLPFALVGGVWLLYFARPQPLDRERDRIHRRSRVWRRSSA